MSNTFNTMTITDNALSDISRELIDKRKYLEGSIDIVGNPTVLNGVGSNLTSSNYFTYSGVNFDSIFHNVKITFSGHYFPDEGTNESCAWELQSESPYTLSLQVSPCFKKLRAFLHGAIFILPQLL